MSSMIHKVKDALKSDHHESRTSYEESQLGHGAGGEGLDPTSTTSTHGQTSMPGTFDSGLEDSKHGHTSHGITTTSGHHGHGASKYAQEPTQGSHFQEHGLSSSGRGGEFEAGTAGAGTGAAVLGSRKGHSAREVPESNPMDPADRGHGSNVMDRTRDDYSTGVATTTSGSQKLHRREDPRSNYDNSSRSQRYDQEASLRRDGATGTTGHMGYDQTDKNTSTGPHSSKIMNKLDPRVDSSNPEGHDMPSRTRDEYGASTQPGVATGAIDRRDLAHDPHHGSSGVGAGAGVASGATSSSHVGSSRSRNHFHCMNCGHKNDASHLRDAAGQPVTGRSSLHCMNCGHRNEVSHLLG